MTCFLCGSQNRLRFCVRAENDLFLACGSIWQFIRVGGWNWLGVCMLAENHLILVWASNLTSFLGEWSKLSWFHCGRSNLTWLQCRDRNWLGVDVGIENDSVLFFGSEFTWLLCGGRKWLGFSILKENGLVYVRHRIYFISVQGLELTWFLCGGQRRLGFSVGIEINLVLVLRHQNWLDVSVGIGIHLDFEWGRKLLAFSVCIGNN